jgi:hypothetical protein
VHDEFLEGSATPGEEKHHFLGAIRVGAAERVDRLPVVLSAYAQEGLPQHVDGAGAQSVLDDGVAVKIKLVDVTLEPLLPQFSIDPPDLFADESELLRSRR